MADNVTSAMQPIAAYSNGHNLAGGRPSAAKTGTNQLGDTDANRDAWMVGFTPSLSTAVWVGTTEGTKPLENKWGSPVYGSGLPSDIWKSTMDGALEDTDERVVPEARRRSAATRVCHRRRRRRRPPLFRRRRRRRSSSRQSKWRRASRSRSARRRRCPSVPGAGRSPGAGRARARAGRTAGWTSSAPVTASRRRLAGPLADDRRSLDDRDLPSRTDTIGAALSGVIGGPVGRHALIGRQRFLTPLRVMLIIALVFLALGYSTKAACLQTTGTGTADQRVGNWENQRAYYELCYSDTVPLYTAELLNLGKFPYKSSWVETDSEGKPRTQYDGNIAVRYMEYPVLTGIYQYVSMALAKTYTALTKLVSVPIIAEVVMFFNIAAFGLALAWLVTVWAPRATGRFTTDLGRGAGGGVADADLPGLHQLRRAGNGFRRPARCWRGRGEDPCWPVR